MGLYKIYPNKFDRIRNKAWNRSKSQASFRGEEWLLSFDDYRKFWHTEQLWAQRGRRSLDLCMTRIDDELPWSGKNCMIISRRAHLGLKSARFHGLDTRPFFAEAITL